MLKANILIDGSGHARLSKFGLLNIIPYPTGTKTGGNIRWMSPELIFPESFGRKDSRATKESDSYAFGMVIFEVLSGHPPFKKSVPAVVTWKIRRGERPKREGTLFSDDLWRVLELCWAHKPESRPSVEVILECLERCSETWKPPPPRQSSDNDVSDSNDGGDNHVGSSDDCNVNSDDMPNVDAATTSMQ